MIDDAKTLNNDSDANMLMLNKTGSIKGDNLSTFNKTQILKETGGIELFNIPKDDDFIKDNPLGDDDRPIMDGKSVMGMTNQSKFSKNSVLSKNTNHQKTVNDLQMTDGSIIKNDDRNTTKKSSRKLEILKRKKEANNNKPAEAEPNVPKSNIQLIIERQRQEREEIKKKLEKHDVEAKYYFSFKKK